MKPTKQTVYLPVMRHESNKTVISDYGTAVPIKEKEGYFFTPEELNTYTATIIKEALEIAAEKAEIVKTPYSDWCVECGRTDVHISYESITDTFDETFKKFEV